MTEYFVTILAAMMFSSVGWSVVQLKLTRKTQQAQRARLDAEREHRARLDDLDCEHSKTQDAIRKIENLTAFIESRCGDTFAHHTGVHVCAEDAGHLGLHTDGKLAWYGLVEFPMERKKVKMFADFGGPENCLGGS